MYLHSPSQGCDLHTVIGCLYVRTTLTSVVFALCRWPVHTNTHGEYKAGWGGEGERQRGVYTGVHTRVYLDIGLSLSIQRVIVTSPSFARAAITFFFSSEFSRPSVPLFEQRI